MTFHLVCDCGLAFTGEARSRNFDIVTCPRCGEEQHVRHMPSTSRRVSTCAPGAQVPDRAPAGNARRTPALADAVYRLRRGAV